MARRRELGGALVFATVNLLGTFVFVISVAGVYHVTGTLDMAAIAARIDDVDPNAAVLIAVGFFVAFGVKLGLFPFHFWLPTVYTSSGPRSRRSSAAAWPTSAPTGCCASAATCCRDELELAATALIVVGAASILYGGVLAISRRTAAEMLAYSAIGQVGYVLVAIGVGGPAGFAAAVLYTIVNALNKTLLFLSVADPRGAGRRRVRARSDEHRRRAARRGLRRQARAVPRRRRTAPHCSRCCSSAARCRSSTPSRSTSTTSGAASAPGRAPADRSRP